MPHLITSRPRVHNLTKVDPSSPSHRVWETVSALTYEAGGLAFVVGSIFFFPALEAYAGVGAWLFFFGSLLYLLVTGHDLAEVARYWRVNKTRTIADYIEYTAGFAYVAGTILFAVGSIFFLPSLGWDYWGGCCFIIGSILFILGAGVNTFQVVEAPSLIYIALFSLTIGTFAVGAALFTVASVPYLWSIHSEADKRLVFYFTAWQFVAGSLLFAIGGLFIFYRKYVRGWLEHRFRPSPLGGLFIYLLRREIREARERGEATQSAPSTSSSGRSAERD